jgi:hypothetical protein
MAKRGMGGWERWKAGDLFADAFLIVAALLIGVFWRQIVDAWVDLVRGR